MPHKIEPLNAWSLNRIVIEGLRMPKMLLTMSQFRSERRVYLELVVDACAVL